MLKFCFYLKSIFCLFANARSAPSMTSLLKVEHNSKILFTVQASKDPVMAPELNSDEQANCCSSCSYGTWHWIGVIGTIVLILTAVISVIIMMVIER